MPKSRAPCVTNFRACRSSSPVPCDIFGSAALLRRSPARLRIRRPPCSFEPRTRSRFTMLDRCTRQNMSGIQLLLQFRQASAHQMASRSHMQAGVIIGGFDPIDVGES